MSIIDRIDDLEKTGGALSPKHEAAIDKIHDLNGERAVKAKALDELRDKHPNPSPEEQRLINEAQLQLSVVERQLKQAQIDLETCRNENLS